MALDCDLMRILNEMKKDDPSFLRVKKILIEKKKSNEEKIYFDGNHLCFNRRSVDLSTKTQMRKLFKIFVESPEGRVSRRKLLHDIYLSGLSQTISERHKECVNHNLTKLISRARFQAYLNFGGTQKNSTWFGYDPLDQKYELYRESLDPV